MWKKSKLLLFYYLINNLFVVNDFMQIHDNLLHCYRGNETQPWIGNTMHLLIELVRKIEDANPTSLDIRLLSVNILHRLRLDGIEKAPGIQETEFLIPFRANGLMLPKFRLLLQLISDTPGPIAFNEFLTASELCMLHRLVSTSVEPYERGDENHVCPLTLMSSASQSIVTPRINRNKVRDSNSQAHTAFAERFSNCPLELGTIRDFDYGSFSPGTIIASIAAGLQPQNVRVNEFVSIQYKRSPYENLETMTTRDSEKSLNKLLRSLDSMDNTYSAGLAGDLAEVCVYQGPYFGTNVTVGLPGSWNNTQFPRLRYLTENHGGRWEMTDSEIIAGIDGIFLSQQISSWVNRIRRLRLSQVLDMYYSGRGVPTIAIETANRRRPLMRRYHGQQQQQQQQQPPPQSQNNDNSNSNKEDIEVMISVEKRFNTETHEKLRQIFDNPDYDLKPNEMKKHLERFSISDGINSGCDRKKILEFIDRDKLKDETYFFSQVLQFKTSSFAVTDEILRTNCDASVDKFFEYAGILLDTLPSCNDILTDSRKPMVDLTLIIDGSRSQFENDLLISYTSELIDVSRFGSYLSVVHGFTGAYMVNRTTSIATTFESIRNFTGPYPTALSLSRSFGSILRTLNLQHRNEQTLGLMGAHSPVILVISQGQKITQSDFESAKRMLEGSLLQFPDLYFIFLTNDIETFEELIQETQTLGSNPATNTALNNRRINNRRQEQYRIINSNAINPSEFSNELFMTLKTIPKRLMAPFCAGHELMRIRNNEFFTRNFYEDYATPNQELRYRISPYYIRFTDVVRFQFQGVSYGEFTVCLSRDMDFHPIECKTIDGFDSAWFNITRPCDNILECYGIYFSVLMDKSELKCSENDCRYPDQVRFSIRHEGLRCEFDPRNSSSTITIYNYYLIIIIALLINLFN